MLPVNIKEIKSRNMRWVGCIGQKAGSRNAHGVLTGKLKVTI
jgi:hypothetical protein